ncbi:MAG: hypothetical protein WDW36_000017 [Sanguina aurantia]
MLLSSRQIYTEESARCRDSSAVWEAAWKSMGQQQDVGMGRAHWRHQSQLAQWLSKGSSFAGTPATFDSLPMVVGVRRDCKDPNCIRRFGGPLTVSRLQEFVADRLLDLAPIPPLQLGNLPAFLHRASHLKVLGFAFAKTEGSGSVHLRRLASNQKRMMTFVRVVFRESDVEQWQSLLNATSPIASSSLVLMRGPGVPSDVLTVKPGSSGGIEKQVLDAGFAWQFVPALRMVTSAPTGCLWGREASKSRRALAEMCAVAMGPAGPGLAVARANLVRLVHLFTSRSAPSDPVLAPAAASFMASRWRILFMDTSTQPGICSFHFPDSPASQQAGDLHRSVCGRSWWGRLRQAGYAVTAAVRSSVLAISSGSSRSGSSDGSLSSSSNSSSAVHVMVFQPAGERRGALGRLTPGVYRFATNSAIDLSSPSLTDADLSELAGWIAAAYTQPQSVMQPAGVFPPQPVDDEELGAVDFLAMRLSEGLRSTLSGLLGTVFGDTGGGLQQHMSVVIALVAMAVLHFVWHRTATGHNISGNTGSSSSRRPSLARVETMPGRH